MVLESIIDPLKAEKHPRYLFLFGFLYSSVAILLSIWIFRDSSSLVMVFLTTIALVPLMYRTIKYEEKKDENLQVGEMTLLREHGRALSFFIAMFGGVVLSYAVWYVFLPQTHVQEVFAVQARAIASINSHVLGGQAVFLDDFFRILFNNLRVLIFCILFAFVYGVGAIFILIWNASVIGTAIGYFIRTELANLSSTLGLYSVGGYFQVWSIGLLKYTIHGIPEILAYFTGGLGAGIISVAMLKHNLDYDKLKKVTLDSLDLVLISIGLLVLAAFLEVYVTPIFF